MSAEAAEDLDEDVAGQGVDAGAAFRVHVHRGRALCFAEHVSTRRPHGLRTPPVMLGDVRVRASCVCMKCYWDIEKQGGLVSTTYRTRPNDQCPVR